jgi:hypothetical protein
LCCSAPEIVDRLRIGFANLKAPNPAKADIPKPIVLSSQLTSSTYDFVWLDDGITILVEEEDGFVEFELKSDIVEKRSVNIVNFEPEDEVLLEDHSLSMKPNHEVWASCDDGRLLITGTDFEDDEFEFDVWQDSTLFASYTSPLNQWSRARKGGLFPVIFNVFSFSPGCKYFTISLFGDLDTESQAQGEIWVLNIEDGALELFKGKDASYKLFDYSVQSVVPEWSPGGTRFVFGSGTFGLEIIELSSMKRKLIAGPKLDLYEPKWSPSGDWIASWSWSSQSIVLLSPDGKYIAQSPECRYVSTYMWHPAFDHLAYICSNDSCNRNILYVWSPTHE